MIKLQQKTIDTVFLGISAFTYAFFSSSTPDNFGVPEIIIGLCLVLFVGLQPFYKIISLQRMEFSIIPPPIFVIFYILLLIPLFQGILIKENNLNDIVRDIIPFIYLFLPVFFMDKIEENPKYWRKILFISISTIGVAFAYRHLFTVSNPFQIIGKGIIYGNKEYFPMDPAVLFTASLLPLLGLKEIFLNSKFRKGILYLIFGAFTYLALIAILVRAQILLVIFVLAVYLFFISKANIGKFLIISIIILTIVISNFESLLPIVSLIGEKFQSAGLNNRDVEFIAVIENSNLSIENFLFGEGWGGLIQNPASPGSKIRFTHNIFNYFLLKSGVIGVFLIVGYFFFIAKFLWKIRTNNDNLVMKLGLFNILLVHLILEPGFKMLSIGLILVYFITFFNSSKNE